GYGTETDPAGVAIGDLNGDGVPDLAVTNDWSSTVSILTNVGAAAAVAPWRAPAGATIALAPPWPDPARGPVRFVLDVARSQTVRVLVCEVSGRIVRQL